MNQITLPIVQSYCQKLNWITTGKTKKGIQASKSRKRNRELVDIDTWSQTYVNETSPGWLANSKAAWDQLRLNKQNQSKKKRKRAEDEKN